MLKNMADKSIIVLALAMVALLASIDHRLANPTMGGIEKRIDQLSNTIQRTCSDLFRYATMPESALEDSGRAQILDLVVQDLKKDLAELARLQASMNKIQQSEALQQEVAKLEELHQCSRNSNKVCQLLQSVA